MGKLGPYCLALVRALFLSILLLVAFGEAIAQSSAAVQQTQRREHKIIDAAGRVHNRPARITPAERKAAAQRRAAALAARGAATRHARPEVKK